MEIKKKFFYKKTFLITGGTGSFGQHFAKTILRDFNPKKVIIFSRDELKQYEMQNSLSRERYDLDKFRFFIGDVRDRSRLNLAFNGVHFVIHAAALKQIPAAEYNPTEFIKTNIIGAQNLIEACMDSNVSGVVALSTDKAAAPINLYGATKLSSDKLLIAANNLSGTNGTKFSAVRYGNVLSSRGSVIPIFNSIKKDRKKVVPITNMDMTRFWITLDQGIDFSIQSMKLMRGGEIFVPKLPSVKITDLARSFKKDIGFYNIGIRPGEKIHEIMCPADDSHRTIEFKNYFIITPTVLTRLDKNNYLKSKENEKGKFVKPGFEYNSGNNKKYLNIKQISNINRSILN